VRLIERLAAAIERGALPGAGFPRLGNESELNRALDARDEAAFERAWLEAFDTLEATAPLSQLPVRDRADVDRIRELAYKAAFRAIGSSDLAGYVSDDFDLLARAALTAYENPWLARVLRAYEGGHFPGPATLPAVQESLSGLVSGL
jgi:hypothetical protein